MHGTLGEEPAIERARHSGHEAGTMFASLHFLQFLIEARQRPENPIEIIPKKIIQENLNHQGGLFVIDLLACLVNALYDLQYGFKGVRSRGASQVPNSSTIRHAAAE